MFRELHCWAGSGKHPGFHVVEPRMDEQILIFQEEEVQKAELSELTGNEGNDEPHSEEEHSKVAASQSSTVGRKEEDKGAEHIQSAELADQNVEV